MSENKMQFAPELIVWNHLDESRSDLKQISTLQADRRLGESVSRGCRAVLAVEIARRYNQHAALTELASFAEMEIRGYLELKLQGFRLEYPEEHAMIQTPLRLLAALDCLVGAARGTAPEFPESARPRLNAAVAKLRDNPRRK